MAQGPAHGYRIVELLRDRSGGAFDLAEGTIYPALYRLEALGLLSSRWTKAMGRRRRVYSLTRRGHRALADRGNEWRLFATAVEQVVTG